MGLQKTGHLEIEVGGLRSCKDLSGYADGFRLDPPLERPSRMCRRRWVWNFFEQGALLLFCVLITRPATANARPEPTPSAVDCLCCLACVSSSLHLPLANQPSFVFVLVLLILAYDLLESCHFKLIDSSLASAVRVEQLQDRL